MQTFIRVAEVWRPSPDGSRLDPHFFVLEAGFGPAELDGQRSVSRAEVGREPAGVCSGVDAVVLAAAAASEIGGDPTRLIPGFASVGLNPDVELGRLAW